MPSIMRIKTLREKRAAGAGADGRDEGLGAGAEAWAGDAEAVAVATRINPAVLRPKTSRRILESSIRK